LDLLSKSRILLRHKALIIEPGQLQAMRDSTEGLQNRVPRDVASGGRRAQG